MQTLFYDNLGGFMDSEARRVVEDLKRQLKIVDNDIDRLKSEMSILEGKKRDILDKIASLSDEKYQEDMLTLVYQQRNNRK